MSELVYGNKYVKQPVKTILHWYQEPKVQTWEKQIRDKGLQDVIQVFDQEDQETKKEDTKDVGEDSARSKPMDMDTKRIGGSFVVIFETRQQNKKEEQYCCNPLLATEIT